MTKEIWKDVIGFEDFYKISNKGVIVRKPRIRKFNGGGSELMPERVLSSNGVYGYKGYGLKDKNNKIKSMKEHRLLAIHFIPNKNPEHYNVVNHIDGDTYNNNLSNLEWCTQKENVLHAKSREKYSIRERYGAIKKHLKQ